MDTELTPEEFDILRAAINFARNYQIARVKRLKALLLETFPGKEDSIARALSFWAQQARRNA